HDRAIEDHRLSDRVQKFPESVIREMTRIAALHDAINLSQGYPDFDPPRELTEAAKRALDGGYNQYSITWGARELRDAIARRAKAFNGIDADPETNLVVTCGATEAMMAAMLSLINPGDEAVIFEPFYENYGPDAIVSGARPRYVRMEWPDWTVDEEELKAAFTDRTKVLILNTPNNPTGKVFGRPELKLIADLCTDHNAVAVTDEIYEHIVFDGAKHVSLAAIGDMANRTITINGLEDLQRDRLADRMGHCPEDPRPCDAADPRLPDGRSAPSVADRGGRGPRPTRGLLPGSGLDVPE